MAKQKKSKLPYVGQGSCSNGAWEIPFVSKFEGPFDYSDTLLAASAANNWLLTVASLIVECEEVQRRAIEAGQYTAASRKMAFCPASVLNGARAAMLANLPSLSRCRQRS
jgi:hypothetical protein